MNGDISICSVDSWLTIEAGAAGDYGAFAAFHYRGGSPRGVTRVFAARCQPPAGLSLGRLPLAGIVVETLPPLGCALRRVALPGRFGGIDRALDAARLNREVRTIARVVVHPLFRGMGLGVRLVRRVLETAPTPWVEALAAMGRVNPFFAQAGMRGFDRPPLPDAVRLTAALAREGLGPLDLAALSAGRVSGFLAAELRRFARRKEGGVAEWLAEARRRLWSQPVYYVWGRGSTASAE